MNMKSFFKKYKFKREKYENRGNYAKNKGTVLCLTISDYCWQSNFYWDDVYAGEAIGIRKVKYITS